MIEPSTLLLAVGCGDPSVSCGDTAWFLTSAALVLIMTPALGFFYGGFVGRKNALATIGQSFVVLCLISVQWVLYGYSLAFGPDWGGHGLIGTLEWAGLSGVGYAPNPAYGATVPHLAYMIFQAMFAIITPALITGSFVGRLKFSSFIVFTLAWATFVYDPIAHWVWGAVGAGGWLHNLGVLDFAGGSVIHINSGIAALTAAFVIGPRLGYKRTQGEAHDTTYIVLGAAFLWFGWFGFNAGSAVIAGTLATSAFVVTNTATAIAALSWMGMSWIFTGKPSIVGAASGAVAGLVAITPASGFVNVGGALVIGAAAGVLCFLAARYRGRTRVDDSLDVWAVHGVGGTVGAFGTGLFATVLVNPGAANGLLYGNPAQLGIQLIDIGAVWGYSFLATGLILLAIKKTIGLRVSAKQEEEGLDATQHGEKAYSEEVQSRLTTQTSAKLELVVKDSDREIIVEMIRKRQTLQVDLSTGAITTTEKEQKDRDAEED